MKSANGRTHRRHVAVLTIAVCFATAAGTAAIAALPSDSDGVAPIKTNEAGLTYGSLSDASSPDKAPDLVFVQTNEGGFGYVLAKQLLAGDDPVSPEAAVAQTLRGRPAEQIIPAYRQDGKTPAGTFTVNRRPPK